MTHQAPPQLWYENQEGKRWIPSQEQIHSMPVPPEGFIYQHSRFPRYLHDSICTDKGEIMRGSSGWPGDLVLALVRPTWRERIVAIARYGTPAPRYDLDEAIILATGCGGCVNRLAHRAGLMWGYRVGSARDRSRTSCEFCKPVDTVSEPPSYVPPHRWYNIYSDRFYGPVSKRR